MSYSLLSATALLFAPLSAPSTLSISRLLHWSIEYHIHCHAHSRISLLSCHLDRCLWFLLQRIQRKGNDGLRPTWLSENGYTDEYGNTTIVFPESYAVSLSAALYMLVGSTDGAYTAIEKSFTSLMMLTGTVLTAYMVSQLSVFLSQINASDRDYRKKMDAVQVTHMMCSKGSCKGCAVSAGAVREDGKTERRGTVRQGMAS